MIYIIGGNGFVGSAIVRQCKQRNMEYRIITRSNFEQFSETECDILINANGNSKKFMADREPLWEFDASVRSVHEYLTSIRAWKYIQLSSCDVYPDCSDYKATKEEAVISPSKQSSYGFHKSLAELCVRHYSKNWLIFRMGGFVGPGLKKNAIYDILHGGPLWLHPESCLQFISTDTAASIILDIALSDRKNEVFNLCGQGTVKLQDVIKQLGGQIEVKTDAPKVRYEVNIDKLLSIHAVESSKTAVFSYIAECVKDKKNL